MPFSEPLFVTRIFTADVATSNQPFLEELAAYCLVLAEEDKAGAKWCKQNGYKGYTSYASLNDLPKRAPPIGALKKKLDAQAQQFASEAAWDLAGRALILDSLWVNVLPTGGFHSGHIHPHSVISGTFYVACPDKCAAIKFEDPRLGLMMAHPMPRADAPEATQRHVQLTPSPGRVIMWESWLRHEVPLNDSKKPRISISFNYRWG